jgi:outer membrane protein assembly factor BamB
MHRTIRILFAAMLMLSAGLHAKADDWPQWMGPDRDGVWKETGIIDSFPEGGPKVLWRVKIGSGYAGPAVADGRVYVADLITKANVNKLANPNSRAKVEGKERVLCLDAKTGNELWKHEKDVTYDISYPTGPRCTPTVHDGKVYALGAEGNLFCLDAKKGSVLWSKDFKKDYGAKTPMWGYAGHPLVDGNKVICGVGGKGSAVVAFDKDTGKELWKSLDAADAGYSPPTLITAGGKKQLVIWLPETIESIDPESGKPYWSAPLKAADGMSIMSPRKQGDYLFAGGRMFQAVLLKLERNRPGVTEVWRGKPNNAVYPINSTPFLQDNTIYGVNGMGDLRAVDLTTGKPLWQTTQPTTGAKPAGSGTAFLVKNGDRFFLFNEKGELIIAKLSRKGYEEISRAKLLEPTSNAFGRMVVWSYPAFANKCVFARNDKEIVCVSLAK